MIPTTGQGHNMPRRAITAERLRALAGGQSRCLWRGKQVARMADRGLVWLKTHLPWGLWHAGRNVYHPVARVIGDIRSVARLWLLRARYRLCGLPPVSLETSKAKARRVREGFFEKYCRGKGLDIGHGGDPLTTTCQGWEWFHGDAQFLSGLKDEAFDFVYSSHVLEHMEDPAVALRNWWRVLKPGGGGIFCCICHTATYMKNGGSYLRDGTLTISTSFSPMLMNRPTPLV